MERGVNNFLILSLDFVAEKLPLKVNEWESGGVSLSHRLTFTLGRFSFYRTESTSSLRALRSPCVHSKRLRTPLHQHDSRGQNEYGLRILLLFQRDGAIVHIDANIVRRKRLQLI